MSRNDIVHSHIRNMSMAQHIPSSRPAINIATPSSPTSTRSSEDDTTHQQPKSTSGFTLLEVVGRVKDEMVPLVILYSVSRHDLERFSYDFSCYVYNFLDSSWLFRCVNSVPIQAYMHLLFSDCDTVVATRIESGIVILPEMVITTRTRIN
jgi:hypothetical protein